VHDHVVDTNVLLVASAAHPYSPFDDSHVPPDLREQVLDWLLAFRDDPSRRIVLDMGMKIYDEYRNKLTDQDLGLQVVKHLMGDPELVVVSFDSDGYAVVPDALAGLDRSDRKFAAVALGATRPTTVVNCADSDWIDVESACVELGIRVEHLLEPWLRATHAGR
jgi:hypothetical protein